MLDINSIINNINENNNSFINIKNTEKCDSYNNTELTKEFLYVSQALKRQDGHTSNIYSNAKKKKKLKTKVFYIQCKKILKK